MKIVRQYVVDNHLPGRLPDRAEPSEPFTKEEDAIRAFKGVVLDDAGDAFADGQITEQRRAEIKDEMTAITIGLVLSLKIGEELATQIADRRYYLGRVEDKGTEPVSKTADQVAFERKKRLIEDMTLAVKEGDMDLARLIWCQIDAIPVTQVDLRQTKVDTLAAMFAYATQTWRRLPADLTEADRSQRSGFVHGILVAAGVPYAVAGEMRPSREWQTAFQTVMTLILDAGLNPADNAAWLIDLPKSEPASPTQEDFAGQIRTVVPESEALGGDNRPDTGDFFVSRELGAGEAIIES